MSGVALIGCGFVADLYMASLRTFPDIAVHAAWDRDPDRLAAFCAHWDVPAAASESDLHDRLPKGGILLNLTNPAAHFEVTQAALAAGHHVYSEKPLAMDVAEARRLCDQAHAAGLSLASAPCSALGEAAQVLARAVREGVAGTPRLIYAELDDGFIPQAPYQGWRSDSGAPWPAADEFAVGCTLEHAGYYLTWLIAMFGSVVRVVAASAELYPEKEGGPYGTPDFSVGTLFFENGPVARLTCSIAAPHDHRIRVVGDDGVLEVAQAWDNGAPVRYRKRMRIRRRLLESPLARRIKPRGASHPKVGRWGAASMNFALGPAEMLAALAEGRASRLDAEFALHLTEVTLAIQSGAGDIAIASRCAPMEPMPWA